MSLVPDPGEVVKYSMCREKIPPLQADLCEAGNGYIFDSLESDDLCFWISDAKAVDGLTLNVVLISNKRETQKVQGAIYISGEPIPGLFIDPKPWFRHRTKIDYIAQYIRQVKPITLLLASETPYWRYMAELAGALDLLDLKWE